MSTSNVEHSSHSFGNRAISQDVSFRLLKGEHIDLVGANGEGKSTFMNIITGKLTSGEDKAEWAKNVRAGHLDQRAVLEKGMTIRDVLKSVSAFLFEMEGHMNQICDKMGEAGEDEITATMDGLGIIQDLLTAHDLYIVDSKVEGVGRALGLVDIGLDKDVTGLPGGRCTKVLLGELPLGRPDTLLLNEPANYLDVQHIDWPKRRSQEYEDAFIPISHDVPLLNGVINLTYHMENQRPNCYMGDYNKLREVYAVKRSQLRAAYKRQRQEIAELEDFVARNKTRVATRNMAMFHQKKLDKMSVVEFIEEKSRLEFHLMEVRTLGKHIFEVKDLITGYDEPLSRPLNPIMERGQKIVLVGANGIGKTTLLKSILGPTSVLSGTVELDDYLSIGYFEQEMTLDNTTTCLQEIWSEFPTYAQYQVRSALAKYGLTIGHIESQARALSGDEQAKVRLCELINREFNVLLLNESANHLGVGAKDELKRALKECKSGILLICHEPEFFRGLATDVWDCEEWVLRLF